MPWGLVRYCADPTQLRSEIIKWSTSERLCTDNGMLLGWLLNTVLPRTIFSSRLISPHSAPQIFWNKCNHILKHFNTTQPGIRPWHHSWNVNFPSYRMCDIKFTERWKQPLFQSLRCHWSSVRGNEGTGKKPKVRLRMSKDLELWTMRTICQGKL